VRPRSPLHLRHRKKTLQCCDCNVGRQAELPQASYVIYRLNKVQPPAECVTRPSDGHVYSVGESVPSTCCFPSTSSVLPGTDDPSLPGIPPTPIPWLETYFNDASAYARTSNRNCPVVLPAFHALMQCSNGLVTYKENCGPGGPEAPKYTECYNATTGIDECNIQCDHCTGPVLNDVTPGPEECRMFHPSATGRWFGLIQGCLSTADIAAEPFTFSKAASLSNFELSNSTIWTKQCSYDYSICTCSTAD